MSEVLCLLPCTFCRNYNIPKQHITCFRRIFSTLSIPLFVKLKHRKRKHIGRHILLPEFTVEVLNFVIVNNCNTYFAVKITFFKGKCFKTCLTDCLCYLFFYFYLVLNVLDYYLCHVSSPVRVFRTPLLSSVQADALQRPFL